MAAYKTQLTLPCLMVMATLSFAGNASAWGINNLLTPILKEGGRVVSGALGPSKEERDRQITEALQRQYDPARNQEAFEAMLAQSGMSEEEKADARKRYEARMRAAQSEVGQQVAAQRAHSEAMAGSAADRIVRGAVGQNMAIDAATAATRLPGQATGMNAVTGAAEAAAKTGVIQAATKDTVQEAEEKAKAGSTGQNSVEKPVSEPVSAGMLSKDSATVRQGNEIDVRPGASNAEAFASAMKMFAGIGRPNRQAANAAADNKPAEAPAANASGQVSEVAQ